MDETTLKGSGLVVSVRSGGRILGGNKHLTPDARSLTDSYLDATLLCEGDTLPRLLRCNAMRAVQRSAVTLSNLCQMAETFSDLCVGTTA
jgi:hypothetical protein